MLSNGLNQIKAKVNFKWISNRQHQIASKFRRNIWTKTGHSAYRPFTRMRPRPRLQWATAVAVFWKKIEKKRTQH